MNSKANAYLYAAVLAGLMGLLSCRKEESGARGQAGDPVLFGARLYEGTDVVVRAPAEEEAVFITPTPYNMDFYIHMTTTPEGGTEPAAELGTYVSASGYTGRLDAKADAGSLNWQSLRNEHTFYGWTYPFHYTYTVQDPAGGATEKTERVDYPNPDKDFTNLDELREPVKIRFEDSPEEHYDRYHNNDAYETFIGVRKGPVTYVGNGASVPLIFKHLVSKICVEELILDQFGSIQKHLQANMTFYGMPTKADFYPLGCHIPANEQSRIEIRAEEPVVIPSPYDPKNYDPYDKLTYFIANKAGDDSATGNNFDYFYICPEVDFSQVSFSISITSTEADYNGLKEFSGNFRNVVFERKHSNWDWTNEAEKGKWTRDGTTLDDSHILHAGEMMRLRILLYPGGGGGLFVQIVPWSTEDNLNAQHHAHPGIYSDASLNELAGASGDAMEDLYTLYGEDGQTTGEKVFHLYENVTLSGNSLKVPAPYVLDGNDHLVVCPKSPVTVQNVRNTYLLVGSEYFYVNKDGTVFKADAASFGLEPAGKSSTLAGPVTLP